MENSNKITTILGKKIGQSQRFNQAGKRIPVTLIEAGPCVVVQVKTIKTDGYESIQLGFGLRKEKNTDKPTKGHLTKTGIKTIPRFLMEVANSQSGLKSGDLVKVEDVFSINDLVKVSGISRGKGFTGVVKRHHFKGGPRTHGQSDRERAPGSIGQTTTPGRVYKGKRMAGRSGGEKTTVKNLKVLEINNEISQLVISGLVPGARNGLITVSKII